jgi:hypothetical protein
LSSRSDAEQPIGGVEFVNVRVQDSVERNPMGYLDSAGGLPLGEIGGTLIVTRNGKEETMALDRETLEHWMPVLTIKRIPRLSLDGVALRPLTDEVPEKGYGFGHAILRRTARFALYAAEGEEVRFALHYMQLGNYSGKAIPAVVVLPSGEEAHRAQIPFEAETEIAFTASETGVYRIAADPAHNRIALTRSSHPVNIVGEGGRVGLVHAAGDYFFWVPAGTTEFAVRVAGEGSGEAIRAALLDPEGAVVDKADNVVAMHQFEVNLPEPSPGAAWTVRVSKPSERSWEDHSLDLRGVPPLFAPHREALLVPER